MAGAESRSSPEYDNAGVGVSVQCPLCGSTARRIPRRALDRVMNALWEVRRFRCANAMCGWEGNVRMKPKHFPRPGSR